MAIEKLHLLVLHFPVALLIAAGLADGLWLWRRKGIFRDAGYFCILLGAAACIPTMVTGLMLIGTMGLTGEAADLGETHESLGMISTAAAVLAAGIRASRGNKLSGPWAYAYAAVILGCLALVGLTGHFGGMLAFGKDYLSGIL